MPPTSAPVARIVPAATAAATGNDATATALGDVPDGVDAEPIQTGQQPPAPEGTDPTLAMWGTPVSEYESGICVAIYGSNGKTTLIGTAADSEWGGPVLLYNANANPHVIRHRGTQVIVKDILRFDQLEQERQKILRNQRNFPFKTIAFDVVSEIHAIALRDRYGPTADVDWTMHSAVTAQLKQFIRNWRDLTTLPNLRVNVIFSMWETYEKRKIRGVESDIAMVSLNKALQDSVVGMVPWMGHLYIETFPTRVLDFRAVPTEQQAKFGIDPEDEWTKAIPQKIYNPSFASIIDTAHGLPWPTQRHMSPIEARRASSEPKG